MVSCLSTNISYIKIYTYICIIMNRHGSHHIRNGIAWVQTGHSTFTLTHQKFESFTKIIFATTKFEFESANLFQKTPKSFEFISGRMVSSAAPKHRATFGIGLRSRTLQKCNTAHNSSRRLAPHNQLSKPQHTSPKFVTHTCTIESSMFCLITRS